MGEAGGQRFVWWTPLPARACQARLNALVYLPPMVWSEEAPAPVEARPLVGEAWADGFDVASRAPHPPAGRQRARGRFVEEAGGTWVLGEIGPADQDETGPADHRKPARATPVWRQRVGQAAYVAYALAVLATLAWWFESWWRNGFQFTSSAGSALLSLVALALVVASNLISRRSKPANSAPTAAAAGTGPELLAVLREALAVAEVTDLKPLGPAAAEPSGD